MPVDVKADLNFDVLLLVIKTSDTWITISRMNYDDGIFAMVIFIITSILFIASDVSQ